MDKPPRRGHGVSPAVQDQPPALGAPRPSHASSSAPCRQHERTERPQTNIAHQDNRWWRMRSSTAPSSPTAEGTGASWYQRDPKRVREMLTESSRLHAAPAQGLARRSSKQYKAAMPELTSLDSWKKIFEDAHPERSEIA